MAVDASWLREPGRGKYARAEIERRFLLSELPLELTSELLVEDRYLDGTLLRLRRVSGGGQASWKLTQKVRPTASDPSVVSVTNIYLTELEYLRLSDLPGKDLRKTRRQWVLKGTTFAVDEFHDRLAGLLLAECELTDVGQLKAVVHIEAPFVAEVTFDERFSGGWLAAAHDHQLEKLLLRPRLASP